MRYRIIVFLLVLSAQMMVFGQSPYDAFDKKQGEKHTYRLPEMVFRAENADTTSIVSYFELDIETLLLKCFAADGNLVEKIQLEQKDVKFISRDPKFEKYFWMSPYAYCANNPLRYIDPTGMDVEITGTEAKAAFKEFKIGAAQYGIKVKMDIKGNISGNYTGEEKISTEGEKIMNAINDKSVHIKINATSSSTTEGNALFCGGAFLGSTLNADGSATARQDVNPADLKAMGDYFGTPGRDMLHEVTEAYQGGLMAKNKGESIGNARAIGDAAFKNIHNSAAIKQSADLPGNSLKIIPNYNVPPPAGSANGNVWRFQTPGKAPLNIIKKPGQ